MLTGALKSLFAVSEAYPDLKANQNFLNLQEELTTTEDRIAYARQFYNDSVLQLQHQDPDVPRRRSSPACSTSTEREYFEADEPRRDRRGRRPGRSSDPRRAADPPPAPRLPVYDQIAAEQATHVPADRRASSLLVVAGGGRGRSTCSQFGVGRLRDRVGHRRRQRRSSRTGSPTRSRCAMSRAKPADPQEYARLHNLVEGLCIASRAAQAAALRRRRPRAQRVRHRPQPASTPRSRSPPACSRR